MSLIRLTDARLAFGHHALLSGASLAIEEGEHVALIGRNGSGKSSLLRVLDGTLALDDGAIVQRTGLVVSWVAQEPALNAEATVYDTVAEGLPAEARGQRYRVDRTLAVCRLPPDDKVGSLSGGLKKRVALARAMVAEPDLLLLDEPTNHLDIPSIAWLETYVRKFRGAAVVVTHDRQFLDHVATRVVELDRGVLRSYQGAPGAAYASYVHRKLEELDAERARDARFDKLLAAEEAWIRKGVEARRTRNEGRVRRLEQLRSERAERRVQEGRARFDVDPGELSRKVVIEVSGASLSIAGQTLVRDLDLRVLRGDKLGLIGANGAGKTSLLKLLLGEVRADRGVVRRAAYLEVAYFDQLRTQLDPEATLVDTVSPGSEWVETNGKRRHVLAYLREFLFEPERARSPVRSLSGGERNRLLLARLFARPANLLVMDEPTNDLDIETLELLEDLLVEYEGTLLLVTHDRALLDHVVVHSLVAEGDGVWRDYAGGYSDYAAARARAVEASDAAPAASRSPDPDRGQGERGSSPDAALPASRKRDGQRAAKLSYREQKELDALPGRIEALEQEQRDIAARLADPELYKRDPEGALELGRRHGQIETELTEALTRWEALEARTRAAS